MTNGENELQFEATIDAESLEEFFNMMETRMDSLEGVVEEGFATMDESVERSGRKMTVFSGLFISLWQKVISYIFQAGAAVKNFITGSIELRARLDTLGVSLDIVGRNAGYSREEIAKYVDEVKGMGITTQVATQGLLRLAQANISWADAADLARVAQNAAQLAGMNSSVAFERMVIAIQRQEPELLDELLINVDREKAYRRLATELGIATKQLSGAQKQQAFFNEVMRQAAPLAGVYEGTLDTVGKQMTSLPRLIEGVMEAVGGLFQEAQLEKITFYTETLEKLQAWFDENQDIVEEWGTAIGKATGYFFDFVEQIGKIPGAIFDAGVALAKVFGDDSEIDKNIEDIGVHAQQAIALIAYAVGATIASIIAAAKYASDIMASLWEVLKGTIDTDEFARRIDESIEENRREAKEFAGAWIQAAIDILPALGDTAEAIEEVADQTENAADQAQKLADAMDEARAILDEFRAAAEEELELRILKETRAEIERALKKSFRVEDIERTHQERLNKILESGEERREADKEKYDKAIVKAAIEHSKRLIRLERAYQRRLRDIQDDFEHDARELARKRDAVGLLELERRKNRELERAEQAHDDQVADAEESWAEQRQAMLDSLAEQEAALAESLEKQLIAADEARIKDYEALERSLDRQKQIRDLHAGWAAEDRKTEQDKAEEELGTHLGNIVGLTAEGLALVLGEYEGFYDDVGVLWEAFYIAQTARAAQMIDMWRPPAFPDFGAMPGAPPGMYLDFSSPNRPGGFQDYDPTSRSSPYGNYDPGNYRPSPSPPPGMWSQEGISESWRDSLLAQLLALMHGSMGQTLFGQAGQVSMDLAEAIPTAQAFPKRKTKTEPDKSDGAILGQAGQVSALLADALAGMKPSIITPQTEPRLPAVSPVSSVDRREIHVTADLEGVDPHLQQVVINTMLEIERNRG